MTDVKKFYAIHSNLGSTWRFVQNDKNTNSLLRNVDKTLNITVETKSLYSPKVEKIECFL